jgi:hypothetical protein
VSEARRLRNRAHVDQVIELRCECNRPACAAVVPAAADEHRGSGDRFVVVPGHAADVVVVRAADRFFVVERRRAGPVGGESQLAAGRRLIG